MEIDPLVESILVAVALLENSPDSDIHPDVAVRGLEDMAHSLSALGEDGVRQFVAAVGRVAARQADPHAKAFYLSVPQTLGVVTDDVSGAPT